MYDLQVEKVLYGGPVGKTLRISSSYWYMPGPPRQIYGLQPVYSRERGDYEYNFVRSPDEEQAETAVAEARLDYHALSAICIFVGKVISYNENLGYTVEVVRLLKGSTPGPGTKVDFAVSGLNGQKESAKSMREPMLYFVDSIENDEDEHRIKCSVKTWLPLGAGEGGACRVATPRRTSNRRSRARGNRGTLPGGDVSRLGRIGHSVPWIGVGGRRDLGQVCVDLSQGLSPRQDCRSHRARHVP